MEDKLAKTKRFFKLMIPGFHQKLNLPPAFCKKAKEEKSEWAILKSRKGTWKIQVCRNCEGIIYFKDGWGNFVNTHGLSIGDIVFFEHIGNFHFNALVFDPTACEKEFVVELKENEEVNGNYHPRNTKGEPAKESNTSDKSQNPHFILTMKPYHAHKRPQTTIPVGFCRANDLWNKSSVTLRDPHGKKWVVKLRIQKNGQVRWRMATGWHDFYVSNKLKDGDVCVFDLDCRLVPSSTVLLDVQIFPAPL